MMTGKRTSSKETHHLNTSNFGTCSLESMVIDPAVGFMAAENWTSVISFIVPGFILSYQCP